jgi:hypothetical protein
MAHTDQAELERRQSRERLGRPVDGSEEEW